MLRNDEYTDRELLHVIASACDDDDVASSDDVADALGLSENGRPRASRVATRLAWMARYGFLERVDPGMLNSTTRQDKLRLWRITAIGHELMGGRLSRPVESAIENLDPGSQLLMMRSLTRRTFGESSDEVAVAVRREYQHNFATRKAR